MTSRSPTSPPAAGRTSTPWPASLLAHDVRFVGPSNTQEGADAYLAVLRRIAPIWRASEVKKVATDGPDVCVLYDFVTDTPAGAVPIVEWLRIEHEHVTSVTLIFDRVAFAPAMESLAQRAAR